MTIQEKNIAIAEMLGWILEELKFSFGRTWLTDKGKRFLENDLKFHSDANWQYEAIEWIENILLKDEKLYYFQMNRTYAGIHSIENTINKYRTDNTIKSWEYFCNINCSGITKREAVFEALYQFSQYLKQKK